MRRGENQRADALFPSLLATVAFFPFFRINVVGRSFALAGSNPSLSLLFFSHSFSQKPPQVIGVGGGGSNAVNRMLASDLAGVDLYVLNTDSQVSFVREFNFFFFLRPFFFPLGKPRPTAALFLTKTIKKTPSPLFCRPSPPPRSPRPTRSRSGAS